MGTNLVKHYTGRKYKVLFEAEDTNDKSKVIVYQSCSNNKIYVMKKSEFYSKIKRGNKEILRFSAVDS